MIIKSGGMMAGEAFEQTACRSLDLDILSVHTVRMSIDPEKR